MITLPNGCEYSGLSVIPSNWDKKDASITKRWLIHYRYYDPSFRNDPKKWGRQIVIKGMNKYSTLADRRAVTAELMRYEKQLLEEACFNPIISKYQKPEPVYSGDINPDTPFIKALQEARKLLVIVPDFAAIIGYAIKGVAAAASNLNLTGLSIGQVRRKHIKLILDECARSRPKWSADAHNKHKAYLSMLFNELLQLEAVEFNPTRDIPCRKKVHKKRELLTEEEEILIDGLKHTHYHFWRYIKIFYYSGSRTTEMLQLKMNKVNLQAQEFIITVRKGREYREDIRPIPDEALPLWSEIIAEASQDDYVFSNGLKPGGAMIRADQIKKRWRLHVKTGLGINKDFYPLKHLYAERVASALGIQFAAAADGHTTPVITMKHYAVNFAELERRRHLNLIKKAGVKFASQ